MTMPRLTRRARTLVLQIACGGLTLAATSYAHAAVKPVSGPDEQSAMWQWVAGIGIFVVCGAIMFKNSKRSHQD